VKGEGFKVLSEVWSSSLKVEIRCVETHAHVSVGGVNHCHSHSHLRWNSMLWCFDVQGQIRRCDWPQKT